MKLVLLGAGASAATLGAPVSANFGNVLNLPASKAKYPCLQAAVTYLSAQQGNITESDWALHDVWNGIDENYKLASIIENASIQWPELPDDKPLYRYYGQGPWRAFWILAGWELRRALTGIYGAGLKCCLDNDDTYKKWLPQELNELDDKDVVASTNYDLLAERMLRCKWRNASNCRDETEFRSRTVDQGPLVLKPHGSLDWLFRSNWITKCDRIERNPNCEAISEDLIDLDKDYWETRPLVIPPVLYKDEIVFPNSQPPEMVKVLMFQWRSLVDALSRADELLVVGYRFPPEDSYGNRLFQEAMRRRCDRPKLQVSVYLLNNPPDFECQTVTKRLRESIFRFDKAQVKCCGAIPPRDRLSQLQELKAASGNLEFDTSWQDQEEVEIGQHDMPQ